MDEKISVRLSFGTDLFFSAWTKDCPADIFHIKSSQSSDNAELRLSLLY